MYENYPIDTAALSGDQELSISGFTGRESTHYPLTVQAQPGPEIGLRVQYDTDVFDADSIAALIERFERVLVAMTADPTRRLSSTDLLDEGERVRLDELANRAVLNGPAPASTPVSIPGLFAARVAEAPDAVALVCGDRSWTYRELDEASNRLAHMLAGHGVGPGQCVVLLSNRSAEAIAAILAVLKTGAAYLPIDPAAPAARIEFMIADATPIAAITTAGLRSRLDGCDLPVIDLGDPAVDAQPSTGLPGPAPDDVAHVIYTSGTTGVPKGVTVTHNNVAQLFDTLEAGVALTPEQVWSQFHSLAFDFSVWEIWGALLHGGRLVIVPEVVARSPHDFHALLIAQQVTVLTQTPSAVAALLTARTGIDDVGDRRRSLPDRGGGSVGAGSGDGQCLRAHRDDDVDVEECPLGRGVRRAADRIAGNAGRGLCVGLLAASGARRGGR